MNLSWGYSWKKFIYFGLSGLKILQETQQQHMALLVLPISNTCSSISNTSNIWQHGRDTSINISSNSSNSSITNTISIISLMDRLLTNSQWYVLQRAKSVFYLLIMYRKKIIALYWLKISAFSCNTSKVVAWVKITKSTHMLSKFCLSWLSMVFFHVHY